MDEEIIKTVEVLKSRGTILYPTDTIWGIGCDATDARAVEKIYKIKGRVESKSLLILVDDVDKIYDYVSDVNPVIIEIVRNYDRPLTVVYSGSKNLAKGVYAHDHTIGIRVVKEKFCRKLIKKFGKPIVSTSANISGEPSPVTFQNISEKVINAVDYTVNYNRTKIGFMKPSKIIRAQEDGSFIIIRP